MHFIQSIYSKCLTSKKHFKESIFIMAREFTSWQEAKDKYFEERRAQKQNNCVPVGKIPTWEQQSSGTIPSDTTDKNNLNVKPNLSINSKISLWQGDITVLEVGAIVNAANSQLAGGGGVDGAIHKAAGPFLLKECQSIKGGCLTGQAILTGGYKLPATYVIQTVGPMNQDKNLLSACYTNSLKIAKENNLKSIVFPCISTGVYGYPNKEAAKVALSTTREFIEKYESTLERVIFCVFLDKDLEVYKELLPIYFPITKAGL